MFALAYLWQLKTGTGQHSTVRCNGMEKSRRLTKLLGVRLEVRRLVLAVPLAAINLSYTEVGQQAVYVYSNTPALPTVLKF